MSEDKNIKTIENSEKWKVENAESFWALVLFALLGLNWNSPENHKISELEKKVARLEGQMSMMGGRLHE